jgi:molecular chaperone DnaK
LGKIIGIDLGTSNSAAGSIVGGKYIIIPAAEGSTTGGKAFPSIVAFTREGDLLVGEPARRQIILNPEGTVIAAKRKIGTDFKFHILDKDYSPQQISAFVLQKIKNDAEKYLGEPVDKAVISVPAYFDINQRQATKEAGEIAGLEVVNIISEPVAASLAYGLEKAYESVLRVVVFDIGGGTLDVTAGEIRGQKLVVKSTSGDTDLGGTDMDAALVDYLIEEFKNQSGLDVRQDKTAMVRIREAAERAKIELSNIVVTDITLPFLAIDPTKGPQNFVLSMTRAKLEEIVFPMVERCKAPLLDALRQAKLTPDEIDKILLIGGPTRMPIIQQLVTTVMGKEPDFSIDPMEAVALGATIQAARFASEIDFLAPQDVTPHNLGIEEIGGIAHNIIDRNTTIPIRRSKLFTTDVDNATEIKIHVIQGEGPTACACVSLGTFVLSGIPSAPKEVPKIEVTFDINEDGILNVTAKDLDSSKEQKITITGSNMTTKEEIKRAQEVAEEFEIKSRTKKQEAEIKNEARDLINKVTRRIKEELTGNRKKEQIGNITNFAKELDEAVNSQDVSSIKTKIERLKNAVTKSF